MVRGSSTGSRTSAAARRSSPSRRASAASPSWMGRLTALPVRSKEVAAPRTSARPLAAPLTSNRLMAARCDFTGVPKRSCSSHQGPFEWVEQPATGWRRVSSRYQDTVYLVNGGGSNRPTQERQPENSTNPGPCDRGRDGRADGYCPLGGDDSQLPRAATRRVGSPPVEGAEHPPATADIANRPRYAAQREGGIVPLSAGRGTKNRLVPGWGDRSAVS